MEKAIEVQGLCKAFPGFALSDVSFDVPQGSIVGFIGENGAGKTTTIKCLLDVLRADSGSISLLGQTDAAGRKEMHRDVGVVHDSCCFHDWLTTAGINTIMKNIFPAWDTSLYRQLLQQFGLEETSRKRKTIKAFSRGMKMKLSLAVAMAARPKLLILDEATSGLDPVVRDELLDIFLEFIQEEDHSILFSSHITSDIEKAADYLVFIHRGKIVLSGEKDELLNRHRLVQGARQSIASLPREWVVGVRESSFGATALVNNPGVPLPSGNFQTERATVDDIMLYTIRGEKQ